ncbi:hypothetical protein FQA39_LY13527 [Lamprigera yunnana]|nr:hypothetical protein FQA39_LY13527 [Lamprigera yunnana]
MKVFIALLGCFLIVGCNSATTKARLNFPLSKSKQSRFEINTEALENAMDRYVKALKTSDPTNIPEYVIEIGENKAILKNIRIEGFSHIVTGLKVNVGMSSASVDINLFLPHLAASVESWESNFPVVFGQGDTGLIVNDLMVLLKIEYNYLSGFQPSKVFVKVGNATFHISGLQNNAEFSQEISNQVTEFLNTTVNTEEFHHQLEQIVDHFLQSITNTK